MPEIPQYYRQQRMEVAQAGQIPSAPRQGFEELGNVLTEFGFQIMQKIKKAETADQIETFKINTLQAYNEHIQSLADNRDPDTYMPSYDKFYLGATQRLSKVKNADAKRELGQWLPAMSVQGQNETFQMMQREKVEQFSTRFHQGIMFLENEAVTGDDRKFQESVSEIKEMFKSAIETERMSKEEADSTEKVVIQRLMEKRKIFVDTNNINFVMTLSRQHFDQTGNIQESLDIIRKSPLVPEDKKQELEQDIEIESKGIIAEKQEKTRLDFVETMQSEKPEDWAKAENIIRNSNLSANEKEEKYKQIKDHRESLATGKDSPFNQSDPAIEKQISDAIAFNPASIDSSKIRFYIGKGKKGGLSLAKAEKYEDDWKKAMDENNEINTPVAKTYLQLLKEGKSDRIFSLDKATNDILYTKALNKFTDYFVNYREQNKKNPTATEVQEFYEGLISGYRKPESPFTDATVQKTLGELESGGSASIFGTVVPFFKSEDAINHVLRNLGPNWREIAPEAAEIIKRKFPEANINVVITMNKEQFEIGEKRIKNGATYEYRPVGTDDKQPWKLVKE